MNNQIYSSPPYNVKYEGKRIFEENATHMSHAAASEAVYQFAAE